jgi:hypothetical protein
MTIYNVSMKKLIAFFFLTMITSGFTLGCTSVEQDNQSVFIETVASTSQISSQPPAATMAPTFTAVPFIIPPIDFSTDAVFCAEQSESSDFITTCSQDGLSISQSPDRRKTNSLFRKEIPISTESFSLSGSMTSQPARMDRLDQNQFGFYFTTTNDRTFAVKVEGQFFKFEEWVITEDVRIADAFNKTYSPALSSAGRKNNLNLICIFERCDLYNNDALIGRSPYEIQGKITSVGFFTASNWDQEFGNVLLESFSVKPLSTTSPDTLPFFLNDTLTQDNGTFSQMGLSGAFSEFEEDGFHFSPVIPYGYYAAKAGPSLASVSVSASISMTFNPETQGTQYAGVVCRSSYDGRYLAVLRVDGTYTIYRDTLRYPFSLLAKGNIPDIQAGRSVNTIRLDCIKNTISLYINDNQVISFEDDRYGIRFGRAGLITKAGGAPYSGAIIFSDLAIEEVR